MPRVGFIRISVLAALAASADLRASPHEVCNRSALQNLFRSHSTEQLTEDVSLIWYPKAGYHLISHAELAAGGEVWNTVGQFYLRSSYPVLERSARSSGRAFYRFKIRASQAELARMNAFLTKNSKKSTTFQSCISGSCKALNRAGILYVPPPLSMVPVLSAAYLRIAHLMGHSRIQAVHFIGKNQFKTLFAAEIPSELMMATVYGGFLVILLNQLGEVVWEWITLEKAPENENQD